MYMISNAGTRMPFFGMGHDLTCVIEGAGWMTWKNITFHPPCSDRLDCVLVCCAACFDLQIYLGRQIRGQ